MSTQKITKWNKSHESIPTDKSASNYAIEKEKLFPAKSNVLDLGGGTGADAIHFLNQGHNVMLIDISDFALEQALKKAEELGKPIETARVTLGEEKLLLPEETIDVVYSRLALHYFDRKTMVEILSDILQTMKSGAKAYITVKSPDDKKEMSFLTKTAKEIEPGVYLEDEEIKSRFTKIQWQEILGVAGIKKHKVKTYKEDLSNRIDKTKSGNLNFELIEIEFTKD